MQRAGINVKLESFEGPLDLLLYLIQSHELDISKVSISKITDQYLTHVLLIQELNFDTASEFLVMAATLLHWKSRALLPQEPRVDAEGNALEEGAFSQEDLVRQLQEHQRFLEAGESLAQLPHLGLDVFTRNNSKPPVEKVWAQGQDTNMSDLATTYQAILVRARKRTQVLIKETVSITDKINEFASTLTPHQIVELRTLLSQFPSRTELVATFLAVLELARLKKMRLYQEGTYASIFVELLEALKNFDQNLATGFDMEARL